MARDYALIKRAIWQDDDYLDLPVTAQWLYAALLTSDDLSYVGVAPLVPARWATFARGLSIEQIEEALKALEAARFVIVDRRTAEVCVRTLLRHDEILRQQNLVKAATRVFGRVRSKTIKAAIRREVVKGLAEKYPEGVPEAIIELLAEGGMMPSQEETNPSGDPSGDPSADPSGDPSRTTLYPLPTTYSGKAQSLGGPGEKNGPVENSGLAVVESPAAPAPAGAGPRPADDPDFDAFWAAYPRRVDKKPARKAWRAARRRAPAAQIIAGAAEYARQVRAAGIQPRFVKHPSTWLNADGWTETEHTPPPALTRADQNTLAAIGRSARTGGRGVFADLFETGAPA